MDTGADIFAAHVDFHNDNFFNLDSDPSMAVDPQLSLSYHNVDDKACNTAVDPFVVAPSIWDDPLENPLTYFTNFGRDSTMNMELDCTDNSGNLDAATTASSASRETSHTPTSKTSRTSSKSSLPSFKLKAIQQPKSKKRTRTSATRQQRQESSNPPRETQQKEESDQKRAQEVGGEKDSNVKRTKFLERNRIAASKCRQKKKEWVHELEDTKGELEAQHINLHREYNNLLEEVGRMKNQLMVHANCNDANIDQWIELEARKFVEKTTDQSSETRRKLSTGSVGSFFGPTKTEEPTAQLSLLVDAAPLPLSPPLSKEEADINYDHMPDELFR